MRTLARPRFRTGTGEPRSPSIAYAVPRAVHTVARPPSGTGRLRLPFLTALIVLPRVVVVCPQVHGLGLHLLVLCPLLRFTFAPFIAIISHRHHREVQPEVLHGQVEGRPRMLSLMIIVIC